MERPEYDSWYRIEIFGRRGWIPAPSADDDTRSADHDSEDAALADARSRFPGQESSALRSPVWGQWRVLRVRGQR